jgi:hypothetical protein
MAKQMLTIYEERAAEEEKLRERELRRQAGMAINQRRRPREWTQSSLKSRIRQAILVQFL